MTNEEKEEKRVERKKAKLDFMRLMMKHNEKALEYEENPELEKSLRATISLNVNLKGTNVAKWEVLQDFMKLMDKKPEDVYDIIFIAGVERVLRLMIESAQEVFDGKFIGSKNSDEKLEIGDDGEVNIISLKGKQKVGQIKDILKSQGAPDHIIDDIIEQLKKR